MGGPLESPADRWSRQPLYCPWEPIRKWSPSRHVGAAAIQYRASDEKHCIAFHNIINRQLAGRVRGLQKFAARLSHRQIDRFEFAG